MLSAALRQAPRGPLEVGVVALLVAGLWFFVYLPDARFFDLVPTYAAGHLWLEGEWDAIYHPELWFSASAGDATWHGEVQRLSYPGLGNTYVYHPWYLLLLLPLIAWLPLWAFTGTFVILNAVALVWIVREALRCVGAEDIRLRVLLPVLLAVAYPVHYSIELGQNTLIALALFLLALRAFEGGRPWQGGALALLSIAAKPWLVLLLGVLPFLGWWRRALALALACAGGLLALPRLLLPEAVLRDYTAVLERLPSVSILAYNNLSVRALIQRLGAEDWPAHLLHWVPIPVPPPVRVLELAVLAALGAAAALLLYRRRGTTAVLNSGLVLVLLPLGVLWSHYLVMGIPLLITGALHPNAAPAVRGACVAAALSFFVSPLWIIPALAAGGHYAVLLALIELPLVLLTLAAFAVLSRPANPSERLAP